MKMSQILVSEPKKHLLEAAEYLFAERGFEAVSVRDITQLAGANVAAVNYHFGSRESLAHIVIRKFYEPFHEAQIARLDSLEKKGAKHFTLEDVLEVMVRPVAEVARMGTLPEAHFCRLAGRIIAQSSMDDPEDVSAWRAESNKRFVRSFSKCVAGLHEDALMWSLHVLQGGLAHALVRPCRGMEDVNLDTILTRFIRLAAMTLSAGAIGGTLGNATIESAKAAATPQGTFDF